MILPALGLAEQDRLRGTLDRATVTGIGEDTIGVVEELGAEHERAAEEVTPTTKEAPAILCLGARNGLDEAAAVMLAQLLMRRGVHARFLGREAIAGRISLVWSAKASGWSA